MALKIKLDAFEGPLDLLIHLIEENEIDIHEIPIAELTTQYLTYLEDLDQEQLDHASEFLLMAATLLSIKSQMLLPKEEKSEEDLGGEDELIDPREELVAKILEYKKYKAKAELLESMDKEQGKILKRSPEDMSSWWPEDFSLPERVSFEDLVKAFENVIKKHEETPEVLHFSRDPIPLTTRITEVYRIIRHNKEKVYFSKLLASEGSETELVVTFLAVLELIKMDKIIAFQRKIFGEIVMINRGDHCESK